MPHLRHAMLRSLGASSVLRRSITGDVTDVKTTFSSWDNCMAASYCKWPVIAVIIVASLIIISIVWCIVRCACCGLSCCCPCFSCFRCCGNCCGCCDEPRGQRHRHLDDPTQPTPFAPAQPYRAAPPMMTGGVAEPPKFANFEVGPTGHAISPAAPPGVHEDALPPMPSWETATKTRVPTEEHESVEMGDLDPATGQRVPLMGGAAPIARTPSPGVSPISAYGEHPRGGFPAAGAAGAGTLGRGNTGMNRRGPPTDPYGRSIPGDFGTGPTRQGIPRSPYNTNSPNELGPAPLRQGTPYMQYDMNSPNELGSPPMRQGTPQMPYGMSPANELGTEPMRQDTSYLPYGMGSVNELGTEPIRQGTPHNLYDMNTPSELGAEVIAWDGGGNDSYGRNNAVELESPMDPAHNAYGGMANGRGTLNGNDSNQLNDQLNDQGHGHASSPSTRFGNDAGAYRLPGGQMSNGPAQRSGPYQQQFSNQADQSFTPSPSQRQYSNESTRPLMGGSQRRKPVGYSPMPYPEERRGMTSPPPRNDSGFDFGGASSNSGPPLQVPSPFRQQSLSQDHHEPVELPSPDMGYGGGYQGSTAPPSYASRSPPPHQGSRGGNPGYRPYGGPNQNRPQQEW